MLLKNWKRTLLKFKICSKAKTRFNNNHRNILKYNIIYSDNTIYNKINN